MEMKEIIAKSETDFLSQNVSLHELTTSIVSPRRLLPQRKIISIYSLQLILDVWVCVCVVL